MTGKPPSRRGSGDNAGDVADSDSRLWRRATEGIEPLKRRIPEAAPPSSPKLPPLRAPRPAVSPAATTAPPPSPRKPRPDAPSLLEPGIAPGLDARTLARLKRGLIPPEAEIDLHHLTQDDAHRRLTRFLAGAQAAERRCVLVITGKGFGAEGQVGILKASVPRWLNEAPMRELVLAFSHATAARGGEGALFVLLRRRRPQPR